MLQSKVSVKWTEDCSLFSNYSIFFFGGGGGGGHLLAFSAFRMGTYRDGC